MRILKTKKKLFDFSWHRFTLFFVFLIIVFIFTYSFHLVTLSNHYGLVRSYIPTTGQAIEDPFYKENIEKKYQISSNSDVIVFAKKGFYFGYASAFADGVLSAGNKFQVLHDEKGPNIEELIRHIKLWRIQTGKQQDLVLLVPDDSWHASSVISLMHALQEEHIYQVVVLGSGVGV